MGGARVAPTSWLAPQAGSAVASHWLGQLHADVILAARRNHLPEEVAEQIRASGGGALVLGTPTSQADQVEALATAAEQHLAGSTCGEYRLGQKRGVAVQFACLIA